MTSVALLLSTNAVTPLQITEAWFALSEDIVAVSNHLPVFHMFQHYFKDLFHDDLSNDLTRQGGESDWLVVSFTSEFRNLMKDGIEKVFFESIFTMIHGPSICDMEVSKHQILLSFKSHIWDYILQIWLHCRGLNLVLNSKYISLGLYGNTSVQN